MPYKSLNVNAPRRRLLARALISVAVIAVMLICAARADAAPVRVLSAPCINAQSIADVKRSPETAFPALYASCAADFRAVLGPEFYDLGDDAMKFAFASVVAYNVAVYGASTAYDLPYLTRNYQLDCAGYAALTWHLARVAGGNVAHAKIIGWNAKQFGNHAQFAYLRPGQEMILDPTVGVIARINFHDLVRGHGAIPERMASFDKPDDRTMDQFRIMVIGGLYLGAFDPSDVIYEHPYPPGQGGLFEVAAQVPDNTAAAPGSAPPAPIYDLPPAPAPAPVGAPAPAAPSQSAKQHPNAKRAKAKAKRAAAKRAKAKRAKAPAQRKHRNRR